MQVNLRLCVLLCALSAVGTGGAVYKYVNSTTVVTKDNVMTVIKEIKRLDGTVQIDTIITDKSVKSALQLPTVEKRNWLIQAGYDTNKQYLLQLNKRVFENVFVGISARGDGILGASISISF